VSFGHGANDGQKGMPASSTATFYQASRAAQEVFSAHAEGAREPSVTEARAAVTALVQSHRIAGPTSWAALAALAGEIVGQVRASGEMNAIPAGAVSNVRNDMYLVSEAIRLALKANPTPQDAAALTAYRGVLDDATKFIPIWVKLAVAIALGLGTMMAGSGLW
jgi:PiT family inorganic phosphate transporter